MIITMPTGGEGVIPFTFEEYTTMCEFALRGASVRVLATGQDGTHLFMHVLDIKAGPPPHDTLPSLMDAGGDDEGPHDEG